MLKLEEALVLWTSSSVSTAHSPRANGSAIALSGFYHQWTTLFFRCSLAGNRVAARCRKALQLASKRNEAFKCEPLKVLMSNSTQ